MNFQRQEGIVSASSLADLNILMIGAGSIGSYTTLALTKMGIKKLTVFDFDNVEGHNIPNQFFRHKDMGKAKVNALREIIYDFCEVMIAPMNMKFTKKTCFSKPLNWEKTIVISAVDSMSARKEILQWAVKNQVARFIDTRMGKLALNIYNVDPTDSEQVAAYMKGWFPDSKAAKIPCTQRGIIYPVLTTSSIVCNIIKRHARNEVEKKHFIVDYTTDFHLSETEI